MKFKAFFQTQYAGFLWFLIVQSSMFGLALYLLYAFYVEIDLGLSQ